MNEQILQYYLKPDTITQQAADKVLQRLNSLNSAEEIASVTQLYVGHRVLGKRISQRIMKRKSELGGFQYLKQVATVPGVGPRRLATIIYALDACA